MSENDLVANSVRAPIRAEAAAASHPAWPAPMTITSNLFDTESCFT